MRLTFTPAALFALRQQAMAWSLSTAEEGEAPESVLARAEAYVEWVIYPTRDDVAQALAERQGATIQ